MHINGADDRPHDGAVTVVDATAENTAGWAIPKKGFRGKVVQVGGRTVGVGGLYVDRNRAVAFLDLSDEARQHPRVWIRAVKLALKEAKQTGLEVHACADDEIPRASEFLVRLGFRQANEMVYVL